VRRGRLIVIPVDRGPLQAEPNCPQAQRSTQRAVSGERDRSRSQRLVRSPRKPGQGRATRRSHTTSTELISTPACRLLTALAFPLGHRLRLLVERVHQASRSQDVRVGAVDSLAIAPLLVA
jgi:hypothetical protein